MDPAPPESYPLSLPDALPFSSEWAVPRVAGRFSDSETSWVLAGGSEGSFLCSLITDFLAEGAGVGSLPRAWRRVGVPPAASVLKKCVRLASTFPSPPFGSSDFAGPRRPRLYGFHTGTRSLSNRKGRGRRRGGREREPRIPKPPGCSQGAQRAVFCAV